MDNPETALELAEKMLRGFGLETTLQAISDVLVDQDRGAEVAKMRSAVDDRFRQVDSVARSLRPFIRG